MEYLLATVLGFLGGLLGSLFFRVMADFPLRSQGNVAPGIVVERQGPFSFVTREKRKPKAKTEREIWEMENGQKL